jgi:hypothetical protein
VRSERRPEIRKEAMTPGQVIKSVLEVAAGLAPDIIELLNSDAAPSEEEAKQLGMKMIRLASDQRARAEISGP